MMHWMCTTVSNSRHAEAAFFFLNVRFLHPLTNSMIEYVMGTEKLNSLYTPASSEAEVLGRFARETSAV